jgi:hypothetical protein
MISLPEPSTNYIEIFLALSGEHHQGDAFEQKVIKQPGCRGYSHLAAGCYAAAGLEENFRMAPFRDKNDIF